MKPASLSAVLVCLAAIVYAAIYATAPFTIGPVELRNFGFADPPAGTPYDAWIRCDGGDGGYVTESGETLFFLLSGPLDAPPTPDPDPACGEEQRERRIRAFAIAVAGVGLAGAAAFLAGRSRGAPEPAATVPLEPSDVIVADGGAEQR